MIRLHRDIIAVQRPKLCTTCGEPFQEQATLVAFRADPSYTPRRTFMRGTMESLCVRCAIQVMESLAQTVLDGDHARY